MDYTSTMPMNKPTISYSDNDDHIQMPTTTVTYADVPTNNYDDDADGYIQIYI